MNRATRITMVVACIVSLLGLPAPAKAAGGVLWCDGPHTAGGTRFFCGVLSNNASRSTSLRPSHGAYATTMNGGASRLIVRNAAMTELYNKGGKGKWGYSFASSGNVRVYCTNTSGSSTSIDCAASYG